MSTPGRPRPDLGGPRAVEDVLAAHLREQVGALLGREESARGGDAEGVHAMRVAARRLRSALATYRPVLDPGETDPLVGELRWLADALGAVRDAHVLQRRLADLVDDLADEPGVGVARRRLDAELRARERKAVADLSAALDSARYGRLVDRLESLAARAPTRPAAARRASRGLPALVRTAAARVDRRARSVGKDGTSRVRNERLHDVRKAAKRARYAAESATPELGKVARRVAATMRKVQVVLGEHQDSVASRALLEEVRSAARAAGEDGGGYGLLLAAERRRRRAARRAYASALKKARRAAARLRR